MQSLDPIFEAYFDAISTNHQFEERSKNSRSHASSIRSGQRIVAPSGLTVAFCNFQYKQKTPLHVISDSGMVELSFVFDGEGDVEVAGKSHEVTADSCSLQFMHNFAASFHYRPDASVRTLSIGLPLSLYEYYAKGAIGDQSKGWKEMLGGYSFRKFNGKISTKARSLLHELNLSQYTGAGAMMFAESKALELLSIYFPLFLCEHEEPNGKNNYFSKTDRQKIEKAHELIVKYMDSPPSLLALSKMAGINDFKLKKGFKEQYGESVFAYLRRLKLERAKEQLLSGQYNVGQAASIAGYTNTSHFAEAFRKLFGVNPSILLKGGSRHKV